MSLRDMSVFASGRKVNLNLFAACCCIDHLLLKHDREGSCLREIFL